MIHLYNRQDQDEAKHPCCYSIHGLVSHNDDDNSDKKDYNGNAHPFPGVPL